MTKMIRALSLFAAIALVAMAASAGSSSLAVTNAAAIDGAFGLEVIMANSTGKAYVEDQTPSDETTYNAEFKLNAEGGGLVIAVADDATSRHEVFAGRNPANLIRIEIHCRATFGGAGNCGAGDTGQWRAKAYARRDNNTWKFCGQAGFQPTGNTTWGVEWVQGDGGANGSIRFLKNGSEVRLCTGLDNDDRGMNAARIGAVNRVDTGTAGTSYMDSFVSTR